MSGIKLGAAIIGAVAAAALVGFAVMGHGGSASAADPPGRDQYDQLLAAQLGISVDKLHAAETAARNQLIDQLVAQGKITADQASRLKNAPGGGFHGLIPGLHGGAPGGAFGPGSAAFPATDVFTIVAQKLGVTVDALRQEMRQGKTLAQIGADHGVTRDVLKTTIVDAMNADLQKATAAGKVTQDQANKMVSNIPGFVDRLLDRGGRGGPGRGFGPRGGNQSSPGAPNRPGLFRQ